VRNFKIFLSEETSLAAPLSQYLFHGAGSLESQWSLSWSRTSLFMEPKYSRPYPENFESY